MLSLQFSTAVASTAEQADAPARVYGGTVTAQTHVPASTVVHLSTAQRVQAVSAASVADIGVTTGSFPATLCRMRDIALATGSGTLSDADRSRLQAEYTDLSESVAGSVNASLRARAQAAEAEQAQAQVQAAAQGVQQGASQDAASHGDSRESRQRSEQAVTLRPDLAVTVNAAASATVRVQSDPHPAAELHRVQTVQAVGLARFQRHTAAAPRPVVSVVA